jgi:anti-anti-sigma factor
MAQDSNAVFKDATTTRQLTVPADEGQLGRVRDFVIEVCDEAGFTTRETNNTKLAVDEACTNIIKHAYDETPGEIKIIADITLGKVDVRILDWGKRFDFASVKDPDLGEYVETGRKGGLGVFLINRLMDRVEYRAGDDGNELFLTKRSHAAIARAMPGQISWRGSLRYKLTMRASVGFFVLIAAIGGYIFARQTVTLRQQYATQWMETRRLAENVANKSKEFLLRPQVYSIEQTTLTAFVTQLLEGSSEVAYVRVVDNGGTILASGDIDEIFTAYAAPDGDVLMQEENDVTWTELTLNDEPVRDITYPVRVRNPGIGGVSTVVGSVHLGVYERRLADRIRDPRLFTSLVIVVIFVVGLLFIASLVKVFVRPIQILTDGVRAIGRGSLDGKISTEGPAEIGAIAAVFNEISEKFKKAQESVLEKEKLQKEIEVAKQIQQALLPKKHPDVAGYDIAPYYQAAREVGGDYYDFVMVDQDTLGVVVADVSGKGVPGSLVMTMIRTALRMEARGNKNASDVMSKMNDFVTDDMKKGMFVTMFYVILDSKNRIVSYASAGHNPMILYRHENKDIFFLNPKGFPVGISLPDETLFRRSIGLEKIKLKKDDMLIIYTDGVTEAMNQKREQYGEERLTRMVKTHGHMHPKAFIDILEKDIKQFTGGNAQNDDITVVAVKEKLTADDVLVGLRKKLIDMVDVGGMSVREACSKMKLSPATYYRYKKRLELLGDAGLKNKELRESVDLKRLTVEERKILLNIIREHPDLGAGRLVDECVKAGGPRTLSEKMIYDELKRLNLNTKELRLDYARRFDPRHVAPAAPAASTPATAAIKTSREIVEELITDVARDAEVTDGSGTPPDWDSLEAVAETAPLEGDPSAAGVRITVSRTKDGIAILDLDGHLDSVSSAELDTKIQHVMEGPAGGQRIVVDLTKVSYISSGGWGILVGNVDKLQSREGDIVVVGMTAEVYDVYELLGFADILRSYPSRQDAVAYLRKPIQERRRAAKESAPAVTSGVESPGIDAVSAEGTDTEWESLSIQATTVGAKGDVAVLALEGIIDTISAERLRDAIDHVIRSGINKIVIDLSQVEYVSSGGWGTFTERLREVRRRDGDIKLFGMDPDVYYIFSMLGFNIVLSSFDILGEAIQDFSRSAQSKPSQHPEQSGTIEEAITDVPAPTAETPYDDEPNADMFERRGPREAGEGSVRRLEWELRGNAIIATMHGMIEASSVSEIDEEIEVRLEAHPACLVVDVTDVDYVSSTGWGIFAKYHQTVSAWGGRVVLCGMRRELYDIFLCLEFHSFIPSFATREDALKTLPAGDRQSPPMAAVPSPHAPEGTRPPQGLPRTTHDDADVDGVVEHGSTGAATEKESFVDFDKVPTLVDIGFGVRDAVDAEDKDLQDMGWEKYGKELRKLLKRRKNKGNDEDET